MNKRKDLIRRINKNKIKSVKNIPKDQPEDKKDEVVKQEVPDEFKKEMDQYTKEDLITELFYLRNEYYSVRRDLELATFRNVQNDMNKDKE